MNFRFKLPLFALLVTFLLAACQKDDATATATATTSDFKIKEGVHYIVIPNAQPFFPGTGKIEVAEVFGYTCGHCAQFSPVFEEWKTKQAEDVNAIDVPAAFGGFWNPYARAYYTAQTLGVLDKTHSAMFQAVHEQRNMPVGPEVTAEQIASFYAGFGVPPQTFITAYNNPDIDAKMRRSYDFTVRTGVQGTPSVVVNGKYRITGRSSHDILRIADALIAKERAAQ